MSPSRDDQEEASPAEQRLPSGRAEPADDLPPPLPAAPIPSPPPSRSFSYQRTRPLGAAVQVLVALVVMISLYGIWATWGEIQLINDFEAGRNVSLADAEASDNRLARSGILFLFALPGATIMYLVWVHRSYQTFYAERISRSGSSPQFTPGSAVGWHVVPVMQLWKVPKVVGDLYREVPGGSSSPLVGWWWGLWIVGGFIRPNLTGLFSDQTLTEIRTNDYRSIVSDVVFILAAIPFVLLIRRITDHQDPQTHPGDLEAESNIR